MEMANLNGTSPRRCWPHASLQSFGAPRRAKCGSPSVGDVWGQFRPAADDTRGLAVAPFHRSSPPHFRKKWQHVLCNSLRVFPMRIVPIAVESGEPLRLSTGALTCLAPLIDGLWLRLVLQSEGLAREDELRQMRDYPSHRLPSAGAQPRSATAPVRRRFAVYACS
jgi:hypothetical protein